MNPMSPERPHPLAGDLVDVLSITTEMSDQIDVLAQLVNDIGLWEQYEPVFNRHVELVKEQNALLQGMAKKIDSM